MKYILMKIEDIDKIDFNQVKETSSDTILRTDDGYTTIKWDGATPSFIEELSYYEGPFDVDGIRTILENKIII